METQKYNPSGLEIDFAKAIVSLQQQLQEHLTDNTIVGASSNLDIDNPQINFTLKDKDGDKHEVVIKIIQRIDHMS